MKLLYCVECQDIVKLQSYKRSCTCGKASGYYHEDGNGATISSNAVVIAFGNNSFEVALREFKSRTEWRVYHNTLRFESWLMNHKSPYTSIKINNEESNRDVHN